MYKLYNKSPFLNAGLVINAIAIVNYADSQHRIYIELI